MVDAFRNWTLPARLMATLVLLNVYDFVSTKYIVDVVGADGEANPLMRWVIDHYTIWGILAFKVFALIVFWAAYSIATPESKLLKTNTISAILAVICLLLAGVCVWNTHVAIQVWNTIN